MIAIPAAMVTCPAIPKNQVVGLAGSPRRLAKYTYSQTTAATAKPMVNTQFSAVTNGGVAALGVGFGLFVTLGGASMDQLREGVDRIR